MKIPIIKYSDKFLDRISILFKIGGITIFPWIILREKYRDNNYYKKLAPTIIRHESIHIKQQIELLVLLFYVFYVLEFIIRFLSCFSVSRAYKNISFEKEAKLNESNTEYLNERKPYSFFKYIKK